MRAQLSTRITAVSTTMAGAGDSSLRHKATPTPQLDDAQTADVILPPFWAWTAAVSYSTEATSLSSSNDDVTEVLLPGGLGSLKNDGPGLNVLPGRRRKMKTFSHYVIGQLLTTNSDDCEFVEIPSPPSTDSLDDACFCTERMCRRHQVSQN